MDNIILIGYMGSGKTTIGKKLSSQYGYQFNDTDLLIEKNEKKTIKDIFQAKGETYFRQLETNLLQSLKDSLNHSVLSTGGGMPCREENVALLQSLGMVVFLRVSKETVLKRLKYDTSRPLLQGDHPEDTIERMLKIRNPLYERAANRIIDCDNLTMEEVISKIVSGKENQ